MLALHMGYKNKNCKARIRTNDLSFATIEAKVRRFFNLWTKSFMMFYRDDGGQNIMLVDDEDVSNMLALLPPSQPFIELRVKPKSETFEELGNVHVIQRCCVKELRREHSQREALSKKKFRKDLLVIRKNLQKANIKPKVVNKLIAKIKVEMELFFIERLFENEIMPSKLRKQMNEQFSCSKSSVRNISKSCPSLFSQSDNDCWCMLKKLSRLPKLQNDQEAGPPADGRTNKEHLELADVWIDDGENNGDATCTYCGKDLVDTFRFYCETCRNIQVCEKCSANCYHNHPFKPFFQDNHDRKKLSFIDHSFTKIKMKWLKTTFVRLKDLPEKT